MKFIVFLLFAVFTSPAFSVQLTVKCQFKVIGPSGDADIGNLSPEVQITFKEDEIASATEKYDGGEKGPSPVVVSAVFDNKIYGEARGNLKLAPQLWWELRILELKWGSDTRTENLKPITLVHTEHHEEETRRKSNSKYTVKTYGDNSVEYEVVKATAKRPIYGIAMLTGFEDENTKLLA